MEFRDDPLVIGAVGGSGTRVLARIADRAGVFMGTHLDRQEDSRPLSRFYGEVANAYLAAHGRLDEARRRCALALFADSLAEHLADLPRPSHPWGAKNSRSMLLLPFWHERFAHMRFLHVVRHGLDMAYSSTDNQVRRHGDAVLGAATGVSGPERAMAWWATVNVRAADYGESRLGNAYMRVRLEDLCARPVDTITEVFAFLGASGEPSAVAGEVSTPATLGRWRAQPDDDVDRLVDRGRDSLRRFGYLP